jgi:hypothetical protein
LRDEGKVLRVFFDGYNPVATSRYQFDTDTSSAGKEVECCNAVFKINIIIAKYVEEVFLGKVCRRTGFE